MEIVAHRGLHTYAPENSIAAVIAALEAGLGLIEVDVRATADGELVVMHDGGLWRTTNASGELARIASDRLRDVWLTDGSAIPTLREIMLRCRHRAVLCVDVKEPLLGGPVIDLAASVGAAIEVWSGHREVVACAADRGVFAAWISNGLLPAGGVEALVEEAEQLGARALSFYPADVMRSVTEACHRAGLMVMSGTPNDRPTWDYLRRLGVARVITDRPVECRQWLHAVREVSAPSSTSGRPPQ